MELFVLPRFWRPSPSCKAEEPSVGAVRETLLSSLGPFLDPDRLQALAMDLGCVQRNRDHHAGLVADSLILSALQQGADTQGRWLDAQRVCERLGGKATGSTSFRNAVRKLQPVFVELLRRRLEVLGRQTPALQGRLQEFADVLIPDGCAFKIAAALAGVWPGTSNPSEFKLHAVYSVRGNGPADLRHSAGRVHDNVGFEPETWVRGALYIWDLGYQDYDRFVAAVLAGAIPLQRLKDKLNPVVLAWYDEAGVGHPLTGEDGRPVRLQQACELGVMPQEGTLDLDVQIPDSKGRVVTARVVCVPFEGKDRWYLTALPRDRFSPQDVAELYRLRWEVELYFRTLRGAVRLDQVRRMRNPESMTVALLASLVAATLGQELTIELNSFENARHDTEPEPSEPSGHHERPASVRCEPAPAREAGFSPRSSSTFGRG